MLSKLGKIKIAFNLLRDIKFRNMCFILGRKLSRMMMMVVGGTLLKRLDKFIFCLAILFLFCFLFSYYKLVMPYTYGDTAFLIETISNLANSGHAFSELLSQNAALIKLCVVDLSIYCQEGLAASQFSPHNPYDVFFSHHAYLILYVVAFVARAVGALEAMSLFSALSFVSIPLISYFYLRKSGSSFVVSFFATAVLICHPVWQFSSIGQLYVDRLFIPLSMLFVILTHKYLDEDEANKTNGSVLCGLLLFGVLGGLTAERNMLVIGIVSVTSAILSKSSRNKKLHLIAFSTLCFMYVVFYMSVFENNPDNVRVQSSIFKLSKLIIAPTVTGIGEYLFFNVPLLLLPAIIVPRLFFAVLPIGLLNIFITVGGAEKAGWLTHYHSHYFGVLAASFLIAVARDRKACFEKAVLLIRHKVALILIAITIGFTVPIYPAYQGQMKGVFSTLWDCFGRPKEMSSARAQKDIFDKLSCLVPSRATVTSTEWGMAAWYLRGNSVNLFPIGVGVSEYLMIQTEGTLPNIKILSASRYKGDAVLANECFVQIVSDNYSMVAQEGSWVLYKKK